MITKFFNELRIGDKVRLLQPFQAGEDHWLVVKQIGYSNVVVPGFGRGQIPALVFSDGSSVNVDPRVPVEVSP